MSAAINAYAQSGQQLVDEKAAEQQFHAERKTAENLSLKLWRRAVSQPIGPDVDFDCACNRPQLTDYIRNNQSML